MLGDRQNKVEAAEYEEGFYTIQGMINGEWRVVDGNIDLGRYFPTLHAAREWCKANPADPDECGKHINLED